MDDFEKDVDLGQQNTRFPSLEDVSRVEDNEARDHAPQATEPYDQSSLTRSRTKTFRRTVEQTKSALRRRTVSNPKAIRRLPRRLRFDDGGTKPGAEEPSSDNHPERRDDFVEKLEDVLPARLSFKQRMKHFTWTWFTMTMATGGVANVLYGQASYDVASERANCYHRYSIPSNLRFDSLYALGCTFFLLNITLFIFNVIMITIRFYLHPSTFRQSFLHPTESLFIPAAIISFGTILLNITQYGADYTGDWLNHAVVPLFWMYCAMAVLSSWGIFLTIWSTQTFTIAKMTPVWIFPAVCSFRQLLLATINVEHSIHS